jgi:O-antigen/teichoic acid export membrane protein
MTESAGFVETTRRPLGPGAMRNFLWMFSGGGTQAILKIIVLMVLARLLSPAEFGLVSAALTVVALADVFGKIGIAPSIVQSQTLTPEHIRSGLSATLLSGALVAAIVYALATPLEHLYAIDGLATFIRVLASLFLLQSAGLVSEALLQREMRFRVLAMIAVASYLFGYAVVAITLARLGFGSWALVWGQIAQMALQSAMNIHFAGYRLRLGFDTGCLREMFRFGFGVSLTQIGNYLALNFDYFVVGRFLGAAPLGQYSRAYLLLAQPANLVGNMADKVLFPALANVQKEPERLARAYNMALALSALTQIPASVVLAIAGPEVIGVLMGPQWSEAVVPFQILVSTLMFRTAYKFTGTLMRASGQVYLNAAWQWSYAAMVLVGAFAGYRFGLDGVAVGVSLAVSLCFASGLMLVNRRYGMSLRPGLLAMARHAGWGAALAIVLVALRLALLGLGAPKIVVLLSVFALSVLLFLALVHFVPRLLGPELVPLLTLFGPLRRLARQPRATPH